MTCIPALAVRLGPTPWGSSEAPQRGEDVVLEWLRERHDAEGWLFGRAGFGTEPREQRSYLLLVHLNSLEVNYDPHAWTNNRTMRVAHEHLLEHWGEVPSGSVVDVAYILGEREAPAVS